MLPWGFIISLLNASRSIDNEWNGFDVETSLVLWNPEKIVACSAEILRKIFESHSSEEKT